MVCGYSPPPAKQIVAVACGALFSSGLYAANSARLFWEVNGHYYQRFEQGLITWDNAKKACESKSAHLATITNQQEQNFIYSSVLKGAGADYLWLGATDQDSERNWKWVTGEKWGYENWNTYTRQPSNTENKNFLILYSGNSGVSSYGTWFDEYGSEKNDGYVCEWSTQNYVATALLPDLNNNGSFETAALYVNYKNGKHTVAIKDSATDKALKILTFATSFTAPKGMVVLEDINANGSPEIGVLFSSSNFSTVQVKDTKTGALLNTFFFLSPKYRPAAINVQPDSNGNGASEIVVLGINKATGKAETEVRDSLNGQILGGSKF